MSDLEMFFQDMGKTEIDTARLDYNAALWLNNYRNSVAVKTTLRRLTSMRNLGWCLGLEILKNYTAPKAAKFKPHPLPRGRQDLELLLECADDWQKILVTLLGLCGLRISEARYVGPQHFALTDCSLKFVGKGGKERRIVLSKRAWQILQMPVLEGLCNGRQVLINCSDRTARYAITSLGKKAGISRLISSHDLRATFATEAYRKTRDLRAVQELLGHSTPAQTQLYVLSTDEEQRDAASFADDVFDEEEFLDDDD